MADGVRGLVARLANGPIAARTVRLVERAAPWRPGVLAILTYHRVDERGARPDLMPNLLSATPDGFERQVEVLAERYRPVSLAEALEGLARPATLPPRAVLVTFDDAYADFAAVAWPILRAAGVPATLFVPTRLVGASGRPFWWDRLWAACVAPASGRASVETPIGALQVGAADGPGTVKRLRTWLKRQEHDSAMAVVDRILGELGEPPADADSILTWDRLRALADEGVTLAPHSRTHPLLDTVPFDRAVDEIAGSWADLAREVADPPRVLAYPSGAHGGRAVEAAREAGMVAAVTTERGGNDLRAADPLRLRRINVGLRAGPPLVRGQLVWASTIDARRRRVDRT